MDDHRMSYLQVTDDERELTAFICGELGAKLLLTDVTVAGEANVADDPRSALPAKLPLVVKFGSVDVYTLIFWLPACGPIKTFGDAPSPQTPRDRVARRLTREAAVEKYADVIDPERTPALILHRSHWHALNRLAPGNLGRTTTFPAVQSAYSSAQRWLRKRGAKVDPFAHCEEARDRRPKRLGPLWVWVQPHALVLVEQGTEIWPWNA
jgi:hypothetical protein